MAYTTKTAILEYTGLNLIRIACVAICIFFFFPMFKTEIVYFDISSFPRSETLTGFNTMFGIPGSMIYGNPFSLVKFLFPIVILVVSFFGFLDKHVYTSIYISGAVGLLLSIIYFISVVTTLNHKESIFDFTLFEMRTGLSFGVLLMLGAYVLIIVIAFLCKRAYDD
jgi:hypothetical protein